ncbi:MAG TPA: hypothetical protein VGL26_00810 [Jatrophihabitans sp.]
MSVAGLDTVIDAPAALPLDPVPTTTAGPARRRLLMLDVGVPALIRVVQMLVQLGVVAVLNRGSGETLGSRFTIWDAKLYAGIVRSGYPARIDIAPSGSLITGDRFAFSPLYPALAWLVHTVGAVNVMPAEAAVSCIAGCGIAVLVHLIVRDSTGSRRSGYVAAWLVGLLPMAVVLQMGYAESLFAALTAAAVLAATKRRWVVAGALAFLAGAARPTGFVATVVVVGIAFASRREPGERRPGLRRIAVVGALGLSSTPLFWLFVALRTGQLAGWFHVQKAGWGTRLDFGEQTWHFVWSTLTHTQGAEMTPILVVLLLVGAVLVVAMLTDRADLPYLALGICALASVVGSTNYWHSKPRLLLAGALLVVPLAARTTRTPLRRLIPVLLTGFVLSAWFGAYMVTGWHYGI